MTLPQEVQNKAQIAVNTIQQKSTEYKQTIITTINNAQVSALPYIENIEQQITQSIASLQKGETSQNEIVQCLQKKGLIYYTAETCHFAQQQKEVLKQEYHSFDRIFCDKSKDLILCQKAGVQWTPARWIQNGTILHGVKSLAALWEAFDCD